jgi:uncharacterized protein
MNETTRTNRGQASVLGGLLALGLIAGGWALGAEIKAARLGDRYVSVRGLAERTVKSDLAIWPLNYTETGDDLPTLYSKTEADKKIILQFLTQQGIESSEIELGVVNVVDNQANEVRGKQSLHRYVVSQRITVQTTRVDQVASAAQKTISLMQQGIVLSGNSYNEGLSYKFTGLNAIKPDMITEATRNARAAAERFAQDAGSSLGTIRNANQGVFSILAANSGVPADSEEGGYSNSSADSSLMKTVRVVTDVQYYLGR